MFELATSLHLLEDASIGLQNKEQRSISDLSQAGPDSGYLDDAGGTGGRENCMNGFLVDALLEGRLLRDD